jgi:hypothetical protein
VSDAPGRGDRPGPLARAMAVAAGSRVLVLLVGLAAAGLLGIHEPSWAWRFPAGAETFHGFLGSLLNPWAHWDGVWYIKIAREGYADADGSTAFFPLLPLLLRYVGVLFDGNLVVTGVAVSLLCFGGSAWLLYKLVGRDFDDKVAARSVIYLSLFPTSFFLQAVYTEALFLLLSLACFFWAREGRWRLAGLAGLLAALTRSTGVLLVIPMAVYYFQRRGWRLRRADANVANLLMVVEGLLIWMAYLSLSFGRPLLFAEVQDEWRRGSMLPNFTLGRAVEAAGQGVRQLLSGQYLDLYWPVSKPGDAYTVAAANLIALGFFVVVALCLAYGLRRLPPAYTLYAVAAAAYPLFFPARYVPLLSFPRFALTVFPVFVAMALFTRDRPRVHAAIVIVMVAALVVLTARFAVFEWVA